MLNESKAFLIQPQTRSGSFNNFGIQRAHCGSTRPIAAPCPIPPKWTPWEALIDVLVEKFRKPFYLTNKWLSGEGRGYTMAGSLTSHSSISIMSWVSSATWLSSLKIWKLILKSPGDGKVAGNKRSTTTNFSKFPLIPPPKSITFVISLPDKGVGIREKLPLNLFISRESLSSS